jgi:hypothetical protein
MAREKEKSFFSIKKNIFYHLHKKITILNQSKIFAGLMIVILNIASRFVTFNVSKTVESYLKFTFSRHILVFAATWMGTRDIYIASIMTIIFIIVVDGLFNEDSIICCLPDTIIKVHVDKLESMDNKKPTEEEIVKAKRILERANVETKKITDSNQNPLDE